MIPEPPPIDEVDALHRLLDEWLDSPPGSAERAALAARLAESPQGAMWLAAQGSLVGGGETPDVAAELAGRLAVGDLAAPGSRTPAPGVRGWLGHPSPRLAPALLGGLALAAALAGVILLPAGGGGGELSGTAGPVAPNVAPLASPAQPTASAALFMMAVALAVAAWWLQRRRA